jgi:hypothetical protein
MAVLGDSAMWGQGLVLEHQFAQLAAKHLAGSPGNALDVLPGLGEQSGRGHPRSGAKLRPAVIAGKAVDVMLPTGALIQASPGDRANFALTFRALFSDQEMRDFLAGTNDRPAGRLFGEDPGTFPTVTGQLLAIREDQKTDNVQLVFLNGGINDVEFEEVLNPQGPSLATVNRAIDRVFGDSLARVLAAAREVFPNAVILVPGYFAALSGKSDRDKLKDLFEFLSKKPEWKLVANDLIGQLPLLSDIFDALGITSDVPALVNTAIHRTVISAAYAHFRTRATIASLPTHVIGPGIVYAHPAFLPGHALFAGPQSLVHSGYRFPGHGVLSVTDEMLETRTRRIPRHNLLGDYHQMRAAINMLLVEIGQLQFGQAAADFAQHVQALVAANPDLPSQILLAAKKNLADGGNLSALAKAIDSEVGRIETAVIASFLHPNPAGAQRYADHIVTAYNRHQGFRLTDAVGGMVARGSALSVRTVLSQRGINLARGIRQLAGICFIQSIALQVIGLPAVSGLLGQLTTEATITLGPAVQLTMTFPLAASPGSPDVTSAVDTGTEIHLDAITELTIENGPGFREIVLYLNGREFLRRQRNQATVTGQTVKFSLTAE